jgi:phosphatidylglycerophosphate synthase
MNDGWSLPMHAVGMLTAFGVAVASRSVWPFLIGASLSFAGAIASSWRRWTPTGGWGPANALTALRLLLLLGALALYPYLWRWLLVASLLFSLALDAIDGLLARRTGCASEFGAHFDNEVDAMFVLTVGYLVWQANSAGAWVLVPGLLRYAFVICLVLFPSRAEVPRSRFGRTAFLVTASLMLVALAAEGAAAALAAAIATLVTCTSFARSFVSAYPGWTATLRRAASPTFFFLLAWTWLDLVVNVRFPTPEPTGWYLLPSLDVTVLLAGLALLGLAGKRAHWGLRAVLVVALLVVRGLRLGDGVTGLYFGQLFNLYADIPLVPELVRYAHSTVAAWKFYAGAIAALGAVGFFIFATYWALTFSATFFLRRRNVIVFAGLVLPFALTSVFVDHDPRYNQRYAGVFGASAVPRIRREAEFLFNVFDHRANGMQAIASAQERLKRTPAHLQRLHHANLYLFFVESYGATAMNRPPMAAKLLPVLRAMESDLSSQNFTTASGLMESATYGGMSWLAHATFLTGVRTTNQLQYDLLGVGRPRSLARVVHDAGYRTVLVAPNTNRASRVADFYDFDATFNNWNFDYAGPPFAWASMPDQYVLDFARRHIVDHATGPLFVTYVLVSSHAPWSIIPTLVPDWSAIGDGTIYNNYPLKRASTNWPDFSNATEPYVASIIYDMDVLRSYVTNFVKDDALIIILGDHQPVSELTENSSSWAVPVHVMSRDPALVAPFLRRGYVPGMVPGSSSSPMEAFLFDFLYDFSGGAS